MLHHSELAIGTIVALETVSCGRCRSCSRLDRRPQGGVKSESSLSRSASETNRRLIMLWTIAVVFFILWLLGMVTSVTMSGFIHVLLVLAIVVVLLRVIQGRRVL